MCYDLIKKYESCRLVAYPDPITGGEPITIGWGSTRKANGEPFKLGDEITQETADALLRDYLIKNVREVVEYLRSFSPIWRDLVSGKKEFIL